MKRLKYYCPFHGKNWPPIAAVVAGIAAYVFAATNEWPETGAKAILLFTPLAVLTICFIVIQLPSPAERELIAQADLPLWKPITEEALCTVKEEKQRINHGVIRALMYIGVLALFSIIPPGNSDEPDFTMTGFFVLLGGIVLIADMLLRNKWKHADLQATMAVIPIDHMFDVVHRRRNRWLGVSDREWIFDREQIFGRERLSSYFVCYLPDGRYVLPAGPGSGYAKALVIVQYKGSLAWYPVKENIPEEYKQ